jgi:hypothetical protein
MAPASLGKNALAADWALLQKVDTGVVHLGIRLFAGAAGIAKDVRLILLAGSMSLHLRNVLPLCRVC